MEIYPKALEQLGKITQPCLILTAQQDMPSIIDIGKILHEQIKHSRWVKMKQGGHMVNMEYPDAYNQQLIQFLIPRFTQSTWQDSTWSMDVELGEMKTW